MKKYTCPMHPQVLKDEPGKCPLCGMALVPVGGSHLLKKIRTWAFRAFSTIYLTKTLINMRDIIQAISSLVLDKPCHYNPYPAPVAHDYSNG